MPIRAACFDFDNTLLLSEACKQATMREIAGRREGGSEVIATVPTDQRTAPLNVIVTRHTIFAGVAHGLAARGHDLEGHADADAFGEALTREFSSLVEERLRSAKEVPGATALLRHLATHNIPCFVNTATPQAPIDVYIDMLGWRPYFRAVFGAPGTKVENLQRAAAEAANACADDGDCEEPLRPSELIHVGDGDNDCRAASEFGCAFIGIALEKANGGSGVAGGGFTKACAAIVPDLTTAAAPLCALLGIPPPPPSCGCRSFDLGFALSEHAVSWPTCQPLARTLIKAPDSSKPPGARNKQSFELNGGSGTHLDAPSHFIVGGRTVDLLRADELVNVPLVVIDCRAGGGNGKRKRDDDDACCDGDYMMGADAIAADEAANGPIPPGSLVCIRTGWAARRYADRSLYYNAPDPTALDPTLNLPRMHFPGIDPAAASLLVNERKCVGIGIDTLSPDGGGGATAGFPAHHVILGADRYILENLHLVDELPARGLTAVVAPMKVEGAPEAPARVFAS